MFCSKNTCQLDSSVQEEHSRLGTKNPKITLSKMFLNFTFPHTISLGLLKATFKYYFKGCQFLHSSCFLTNTGNHLLWKECPNAWYVRASEEFTKVRQTRVVNAFLLEHWNICKATLIPPALKLDSWRNFSSHSPCWKGVPRKYS